MGYKRIHDQESQQTVPGWGPAQAHQKKLNKRIREAKRR